ncbi:MAG: hypothetical protein KF878_02565 [Planctomycetes bacterium]|nr:hypothetical protein [Planctomycetota bacterium]
MDDPSPGPARPEGHPPAPIATRLRPPNRCAGCHDRLLLVRAAAVCGACGAALHPECARGLGACPTLGCGRPLPRPARRSRAEVDPRARVLVVVALHAASLVLLPIALGAPPPPRVVWPAPGPYPGPMSCTVFAPSAPPPRHDPDWRVLWNHRCTCPCPHTGLDDPSLGAEHFTGPLPPNVLRLHRSSQVPRRSTGSG